MPFIKTMKNHDWGICTNCRHFSEFGEWSSCHRSGDPFSKSQSCDLFEPRGCCDTCARNVGVYNARGVKVVECMDCGSTSFLRYKTDCSGYREVRE